MFSLLLFWSLLVPQVALLDIDICGPSIPKMMGLEGEQVRAMLQNAAKWSLTANYSAKLFKQRGWQSPWILTWT